MIPGIEKPGIEKPGINSPSQTVLAGMGGVSLHFLAVTGASIHFDATELAIIAAIPWATFEGQHPIDQGLA